MVTKLRRYFYRDHCHADYGKQLVDELLKQFLDERKELQERAMTQTNDLEKNVTADP